MQPEVIEELEKPKTQAPMYTVCGSLGRYELHCSSNKTSKKLQSIRCCGYVVCLAIWPYQSGETGAGAGAYLCPFTPMFLRIFCG